MFVDQKGRIEFYFKNQSVVFATLHRKDLVVRDLFQSELGLTVCAEPVDTDQFGTFSGELERVGTIRENLRRKILAVNEKAQTARYALASEGSFFPDPNFPLKQCNLESLLFIDRVSGVEVYSEFLAHEVVHAETTVSSRSELEPFLEVNQFPSHAVIVHSVLGHSPIYKGIQTESDLEAAVKDCQRQSGESKFRVMTDLRAHLNPTRQKAIHQAGLKLVEALKTFCPECEHFGFRIVNGIPGLECEACSAPSSFSKAVLFECPSCLRSERRPRPDGVTRLNAEHCEFCNP